MGSQKIFVIELRDDILFQSKFVKIEAASLEEAKEKAKAIAGLSYTVIEVKEN